MDKKEYLVKTSPEAKEKFFFRAEIWGFTGWDRSFIYSSVLSTSSEEAKHFMTQLYRKMFSQKVEVEMMAKEEWFVGKDVNEEMDAQKREESLAKDRARKNKSVTEELVSVEVGK